MLWCADRNKESWECVSVPLVRGGRRLRQLPRADVEAPRVAPAEGPKGPGRFCQRSSLILVTSFPFENLFILSEGDFRLGLEGRGRYFRRP